MDTISLTDVLEDQQSIFYRDQDLVQRDIDINKYISSNHIIVITGIRRSGKSTLLKLFASKNKGCYVRFDDVRFSNFEIQDFAKIEQYALQKYGTNPVFYLDEVQDINLWEKWVNDLHSKGYKVFVTGSNAKLLSSELATYLTGRHISLNLMPFSFIEILLFNKIDLNLLDVKTKAKIMKLFDIYIKEGGFPEVVILKNSDLVSQYYQDNVTKDIILRHGFKLKKDVIQFGLYTLSNIGKPISYSKIQSAIKIKSLETVKSYFDSFVESFLLYTIQKFDYSVKKQIFSSSKVYSGEQGFILKVGFHFSKEYGRLLENIVFLQLKRQGKEIYYHKEKKECDFVIKQGLKIVEAIQVCYNLDEDNKKREVSGLVEACKTHKLKKGLILTYDQEDSFQKDGVKIKVMPVWKWLISEGN